MPCRYVAKPYKPRTHVIRNACIRIREKGFVYFDGKSKIKHGPWPEWRLKNRGEIYDVDPAILDRFSSIVLGVSLRQLCGGAITEETDASGNWHLP